MSFGLLSEMRWNGDVDDSCVVMESRCVGRVAFLAPLANFADFGDHGIFSFGRRVSESVPQDRVGVEVSIGVQNFTVAE